MADNFITRWLDSLPANGNSEIHDAQVLHGLHLVSWKMRKLVVLDMKKSKSRQPLVNSC